MPGQSRWFQRLLIGGFLVVVYGVPSSQILVELYSGTAVRCTDLFRTTPTTKHLRNYEKSLERAWWGQQLLRPTVQHWLFTTVRRTSRKVIPGGREWLFYRPGVDYLIARNGTVQDEQKLKSGPSIPGRTCRGGVLRAIVHFRDQLHKRGLKLLVVPIPGKAVIYPDRLTRRATDAGQEVRSPTEELLRDLEHHGVQAVNLFDAFRAARRESEKSNDREYLYLKRDTHWTPHGARIAADTVARKLEQLGWTAEHPYKYTTRTVEVKRTGDIIAMLGLPHAADIWPAEAVSCDQVIDPFLQTPLLPNPNQRPRIYMNQHLLDTPMESIYLLLGDSYSRIYQLPEPPSLGIASPELVAVTGREAASSSKRRLLPGSAGFPSLLANALSAPVDFIVSDGGAATEVRQTLSVAPESLDHKQVLIWEFAERDVRLGLQGWQDVPLPETP